MLTDANPTNQPYNTPDGTGVRDFIPARYQLGPNPLDRTARGIHGQSFLHGPLTLVAPRGEITGEGNIDLTGNLTMSGSATVSDLFVNDDLVVQDDFTVVGTSTLALDVVLGAQQIAQAWTTSFTPTITQSVTVTKTVVSSRYVKIGRTVIWAFNCTITGSGTAANVIFFTIPFTAAVGSVCTGTCYLYDSSAGINYVGTTFLSSTTQMVFSSGANNQNYMGGTNGVFVSGLASGDSVFGLMIYEAAS